MKPGVHLDVQVDEAKLRRIERLLAGIPRGLPKAVTRAVNQTAVTGRAKAIDEVAGDLALAKKDIRASMRLVRATWRNWVARVGVTGRRVPLIRFAANQTRRGVSYRVRRRGGRQTIRHAFIAMMPSGHKAALVRKGKRRLPIRELRGPSIPYVLEEAPGVLARTMERTQTLLPRNLDQKVAALLEKGR